MLLTLLLNTTPTGKWHIGCLDPSGLCNGVLFKGGHAGWDKWDWLVDVPPQSPQGQAAFECELSHSHAQKHTRMNISRHKKVTSTVVPFEMLFTVLMRKGCVAHTQITRLYLAYLSCVVYTLWLPSWESSSLCFCRAWGWKVVFGYMLDLLQGILKYGYHLVLLSSLCLCVVPWIEFRQSCALSTCVV